MMNSWHSRSSVAVVTPGRTCGAIMSSVSAASRPAARMPAKSSGRVNGDPSRVGAAVHRCSDCRPGRPDNAGGGQCKLMSSARCASRRRGARASVTRTQRGQRLAIWPGFGRTGVQGSRAAQSAAQVPRASAWLSPVTWARQTGVACTVDRLDPQSPARRRGGRRRRRAAPRLRWRRRRSARSSVPASGARCRRPAWRPARGAIRPSRRARRRGRGGRCGHVQLLEPLVEQRRHVQVALAGMRGAEHHADQPHVAAHAPR